MVLARAAQWFTAPAAFLQRDQPIPFHGVLLSPGGIFHSVIAGSQGNSPLHPRSIAAAGCAARDLFFRSLSANDRPGSNPSWRAFLERLAGQICRRELWSRASMVRRSLIDLLRWLHCLAAACSAASCFRTGTSANENSDRNGDGSGVSVLPGQVGRSSRQGNRLDAVGIFSMLHLFVCCWLCRRTIATARAHHAGTGASLAMGYIGGAGKPTRSPPHPAGTREFRGRLELERTLLRVLGSFHGLGDYSRHVVGSAELLADTQSSNNLAGSAGLPCLHHSPSGGRGSELTGGELACTPDAEIRSGRRKRFSSELCNRSIPPPDPRFRANPMKSVTADRRLANGQVQTDGVVASARPSVRGLAGLCGMDRTLQSFVRSRSIPAPVGKPSKQGQASSEASIGRSSAPCLIPPRLGLSLLGVLVACLSIAPRSAGCSTSSK